MKRLLIMITFVVFAAVAGAQPLIDVGLKGGLNTSKISIHLEDYTENNILKMHLGAFGRIGWSKVFIQPEVYFTKKGGEFSADPLHFFGEFDYSSVDVPLLFGVNLFDFKAADVHLIAGPVFGALTRSDLSGENEFDEQYFRDRYVGLQYGAGVDVLFLTIDLRMEHSGTVYDYPTFDGKNSSFMITVGFKIL